MEKVLIPDRPTHLLELARGIARGIVDFQTVRGPGDGDRATHAFMRELRQQATAAFRHDYAEQKICGETAFAADFYFPEEATVVEVALGLPNSASEFEKGHLKGNHGARLRIRSRSPFLHLSSWCKEKMLSQDGAH